MFNFSYRRDLSIYEFYLFKGFPIYKKYRTLRLIGGILKINNPMGDAPFVLGDKT